MVLLAGLEPARCCHHQIFLLLHVAMAALIVGVVVWTIPSPCLRLGARHLVSTRSHVGFARDCLKESFPEFDAIQKGVSNPTAQFKNKFLKAKSEVSAYSTTVAY